MFNRANHTVANIDPELAAAMAQERLMKNNYEPLTLATVTAMYQSRY